MAAPIRRALGVEVHAELGIPIGFGQLASIFRASYAGHIAVPAFVVDRILCTKSSEIDAGA
jgi:hypothetical protein